MENKEVKKERERIKHIIERKFEAVIGWRNKNIKSNKKVISKFENLMDDILFLINNSNYERMDKGEKKKRAEYFKKQKEKSSYDENGLFLWR